MIFVGQQSLRRERPAKRTTSGRIRFRRRKRQRTDHTHIHTVGCEQASWFCSFAVKKKRKRNLGSCRSCSWAQSLYTYPADHWVIPRWIVAGNAQHPHERKQESPPPWGSIYREKRYDLTNRKLFLSFSLPFWKIFTSFLWACWTLTAIKTTRVFYVGV